MGEPRKRVKAPEIKLDHDTYLRIPIKTHVVMENDVLIEVVKKYTEDHVKPGDLLFVTEKIFAITQ